jgi:glycosyltransferase involved in cell wall biosynthesis
MRWVFINHRYAPFLGGSERHVQVLAEHLAQRGNEVSVVTTNAFDLEFFWDRAARRVRRPAVEQINGVTVRRVQIAHGWNQPLTFQGGRRAMGEASRVLSWERPFREISLRFPRLPGLSDCLLEGGVPDVIFATNLGLEGLALHAYDVARANDAAFVLMPLLHLGVEGDPIPRRYVSMPQQRRLLRNADLIFAMTDMEAEFIASLGVSKERIAVVGVGICPGEVTGGDRERFRRKHQLHGFVAGSLGALAPDKGTLDLVRAVGRARLTDEAITLVAAGPALSSFSGWWEGLPAVEREGVRLLGVISQADKRDMLAAIDVLALPSRTESFGIVYLEAWANRKPVIAAMAGAVPELVRPRENGLLVEFGKPDAIAAALLALKLQPHEAVRLGEAGERLMREQYTWPHVLARMDSAYERVLGIDVAG